MCPPRSSFAFFRSQWSVAVENKIHSSWLAALAPSAVCLRLACGRRFGTVSDGLVCVLCVAPRPPCASTEQLLSHTTDRVTSRAHTQPRRAQQFGRTHRRGPFGPLIRSGQRGRILAFTHHRPGHIARARAAQTGTTVRVPFTLRAPSDPSQNISFHTPQNNGLHTPQIGSHRARTRSPSW